MKPTKSNGLGAGNDGSYFNPRHLSLELRESVKALEVLRLTRFPLTCLACNTHQSWEPSEIRVMACKLGGDNIAVALICNACAANPIKLELALHFADDALLLRRHHE
jgi:hypothetical protein